MLVDTENDKCVVQIVVNLKTHINNCIRCVEYDDDDVCLVAPSCGAI